MFLEQRLGHLDFHQKNGMRQSLVDEDLRRADDLLLIAFRKDDALGIALGLVVDAVHHSAGAAEELFEAAAVGVVVGNGLLRHARLRSGPGNRHRHVEQNAIVEGLGDQILAAESKSIGGICAKHRVWHFFLRQIGK